VALLLLGQVAEDDREETELEILLGMARLVRKGLRERPIHYRFDAEYEGHSNTSLDTWIASVGSIQKEIASGKLQKTVLARASMLSANKPFDRETIMKRLAGDAPHSFLFLRGADDHTAFLGATPELLFRVTNDHLRVESLAGTRPRGKTPKEDARLAEELVTSEKERGEQLLVTDHLARCMTELCEDVRVDAAPEIRRFSNLQHLHSAMDGRLRREVSLDQVLKTLHPTPATCGSPTQPALKLIRKLEPSPRGLYAGVVGWVDQNYAEFAVAIRSALVNGAEAHVYAGAGIVAESVAEEEYEECALKMSVMHRALVEALH
jgi:isochorismate synthase